MPPLGEACMVWRARHQAEDETAAFSWICSKASVTLCSSLPPFPCLPSSILHTYAICSSWHETALQSCHHGLLGPTQTVKAPRFSHQDTDSHRGACATKGSGIHTTENFFWQFKTSHGRVHLGIYFEIR